MKRVSFAASSSSSAPMATTSSVTIRLGYGNFIPWKMQMFTHLWKHSLLSHVDDSLIVPAETISTTSGEGEAQQTMEINNPDYATW